MSEALILYDIIILGNTNTGKSTLKNYLANTSPLESQQQRGNSRISMTKIKYQLNSDVTFSVRYWVSKGDFRTYSNFIKTIENIKGVIVLVDLSGKQTYYINYSLYIQNIQYKLTIQYTQHFNLQKFFWISQQRQKIMGEVSRCISLKFIFIQNKIDRQSIQKLENYFICFQRRNLPLFLVGNKCDLERQVTQRQMMNIAQRFNAQYYEVSMLTGENNQDLYQGILLSTLNENYSKGCCHNFMKNTRELQNQRKRSFLYRYALEQVHGSQIRKDILDHTLINTIPQQQIQESQQEGYSRGGQDQQQFQGTLVSNYTQYQGFFSKLLSNNTMMNDFSSTVIKSIQYKPQKIDLIN